MDQNWCWRKQPRPYFCSYLGISVEELGQMKTASNRLICIRTKMWMLSAPNTEQRSISVRNWPHTPLQSLIWSILRY